MAGETVVTVCNPLKQGDGMSSYISYTVNVETPLRDLFGGPKFSVVRRYSDFVWLHDMLVLDCPGYIVPPLPEKAVVGRFSPEFVQSRQISLEKFLQRVVDHPHLQRDPSVKSFSTMNEEAFRGLKASTKAKLKAAAGGGGFLSWVSSKGSGLMSSFGSGGASSKTAEDVSFEELAAYVNELEPLLQAVIKHTQMLIRRRRELANSLVEFGLAFSMLGESEADGLGSALGRFGTVAGKLAVFTNTHAEGERLFFDEPIRDYLRMIGAVKSTLIQRDTQHQQHRAALADLESKRATVMKVTGVVGKDIQRQKAEADVKVAQERVLQAQTDYDAVAKTILEEMGRFKVDKFLSFRKFILDYVNLQVAYNQKLEKAWESLVSDLETARQQEARQQELSRNPEIVVPLTESTPADEFDPDSGSSEPSAAIAALTAAAMSMAGLGAGAGAGAGTEAGVGTGTAAGDEGTEGTVPAPSEASEEPAPSAPVEGVISSGGAAAPSTAATPAPVAAAPPAATSQVDIDDLFGAPEPEDLL